MTLDPDYDDDGYPCDELDWYYDWLATKETNG
jgi:hypothetical protein